MHASVAFTPSLSHKEKQKRLFLSISIIRCWPMILHKNRIKLLLLKTPSVNQPPLLFFTIHMVDQLRKEIRKFPYVSIQYLNLEQTFILCTYTHSHWATALRNTKFNFHDTFSYKYEGLEWWSTSISDIWMSICVGRKKKKKGWFTPSRTLGEKKKGKYIYIYIHRADWQLAYPKWLLLNNE